MAKSSEFSRCTIRCGMYTVDNVRLRTATIELAAQGDVSAQNAIAKQFSRHLRNIGVFSLSENNSATITYSMLGIDK